MKQNDLKQLNKIGLTGGIASGKSTVSARLASLGAHILDADAISRTALSTYGPCYNDVIALFGREVVSEDDSLNRARISELIFSDESLRLALNAIVHPYVLKAMHEACEQIVSNDQNALVVFDIPLLFECGADADMDCVIVVTADDSLRIHRIMNRNGLSEEEAKARIEAQLPQHEQARRADFVINNNGTLEQLYAQVDDVFGRITGISQ